MVVICCEAFVSIEGYWLPQKPGPESQCPPSPAASSALLGYYHVFFEMTSFADVVVPHRVGVRTTGVTTFRLVFAFCESPMAGAFQPPKPTSGSDRRTTFATFLPNTTLEIDLLLRQFALIDLDFLLMALPPAAG